MHCFAHNVIIYNSRERIIEFTYEFSGADRQSYPEAALLYMLTLFIKHSIMNVNIPNVCSVHHYPTTKSKVM